MGYYTKNGSKDSNNIDNAPTMLIKNGRMKMVYIMLFDYTFVKNRCIEKKKIGRNRANCHIKPAIDFPCTQQYMIKHALLQWDHDTYFSLLILFPLNYLECANVGF